MNNQLTAVLLAGGRGTRLQELTHEQIPKPMVPLCGVPLIRRQMDMLLAQGVRRFILTVGYLREQIRAAFGDGIAMGAEITYIEEETPLGSGGALWYLKERMQEDFLILNADLVLDFDVGRMVRFHKAHQVALTLLAHPNMHPQDSDLVVCRGDALVTAFIKKNEPRTGLERNLVNAGVFVCSPEALSVLGERPVKMELEHGFVQTLLEAGEPVYAYRSSEYVRDAGTPERMARAEADLQSGAIAARNLQRRQKCIFLDRDGTLNECRGFLRRPEEMQLLPHAAEAVRRINESGYLAIVVTNQPVIAHGECNEATLCRIHGALERQLGREGAYLDDLFYCPHHPDRGFPGERPELKFCCNCRKPATGMLLAAAEKYNIDLAFSWMVGDTNRDIQLGRNAHMRTVRVFSPEGEAEKTPLAGDYTCEDVLQAVEKILSLQSK